ILALAAAGMLDKQIGADLGLSLNSLRTYWKRIRAKIGEVPRGALTSAYASRQLAEEDEEAFGPLEHDGWILNVRTMMMLASDTVNDQHGLERGKPHSFEAYEGAYHPEDRERARAEIHRVLRGESPHVHVIFRIVAPQGVVLLNLMVAGFRNKTGELVRLIGFRLATKDLRSAMGPNIRIGNWSREIPDGELWIDHNFREIFEIPLNAPASAERILARIHPDDRAAFAGFGATAAFDRHGSSEFESRLLRQNGDAIRLRSKTLLLKTSEGARAQGTVVAIELDHLDQRGGQIHPERQFFESSHNNIPRPLDSFVGRSEEVERLLELIASHRLVTVAGPGGNGKTRLVIEVGSTMAQRTFDGAWFIRLAPLSDGKYVCDAIAEALSMGERSHKTVERSLLEYLEGKSLFLLLDNCEHLAAEVARVAESVLRHCPGVRIVATSREPLGLPGEVVYRLPPLSLPLHGTEDDLEAMEESEAVRLFCERARLAASDFRLSEANSETIASIVRTLDGLPLAIELTARRVSSLPLDAIAEWLKEHLHELHGTAGMEPRQKTLRALVEWSIALLTPAEQTVLARLSVFADGWELDAAKTVCQGAGITGEEVAAALGGLVDRSLVMYAYRPGSNRYLFLNLIRLVAAEKLAERGEVEFVRGRYVRYFNEFVAGLTSRLRGPHQKEAKDRIELEIGSIRAGMDFDLAEREDQMAQAELCAAMGRYWNMAGHLAECIDRIREILDRPIAKEPTRLRAALLRSLADGYLENGEFAKSLDASGEALKIEEELGDVQGISGVLELHALGLHGLGKPEEAQVMLERSLSLLSSTKDYPLIADLLNNLGYIAYTSGNYETARRHYGESLSIARRMGYRLTESAQLHNLGHVSWAEGDLASAENLIRQALAIAQQLGFRPREAGSFHSLSRIAMEKEDFGRAFDDLRTALQIYWESGGRLAVLRCFETAVQCLAKMGQWERAAILAGVCEGRRRLLDSGSPEVALSPDESLALIRKELGTERFEAYFDEGVSMDVHTAVDLASQPL
ncbi:MAG TPA: tetratricopeptide repeat protein, partial [Fimbriimonadaceae bacterium]|nr:tetratricopeptide repeat protein [Fimbriimonadaceae bacterium]